MSAPEIVITGQCFVIKNGNRIHDVCRIIETAIRVQDVGYSRIVPMPLLEVNGVEYAPIGASFQRPTPGDLRMEIERAESLKRNAAASFARQKALDLGLTDADIAALKLGRS